MSKLFYRNIYLRSAHWRNTRKQIMDKCNYCFCCEKNKEEVIENEEKLEVHHITYKNLWKEKEWDLIVICSLCHDEIHDRIKLNLPDRRMGRIYKLENAHLLYRNEKRRIKERAFENLRKKDFEDDLMNSLGELNDNLGGINNVLGDLCKNVCDLMLEIHYRKK